MPELYILKLRSCFNIAFEGVAFHFSRDSLEEVDLMVVCPKDTLDSNLFFYKLYVTSRTFSFSSYLQSNVCNLLLNYVTFLGYRVGTMQKMNDLLLLTPGISDHTSKNSW